MPGVMLGALLDRRSSAMHERTDGTDVLTNDMVLPSDISPVRYAHDAKETQR